MPLANREGAACDESESGDLPKRSSTCGYGKTSVYLSWGFLFGRELP